MQASDWMHCFSTVPARTRESVVALLQRSGLCPSAMPAEPEGYGLVVLGAVDAQVIDCIRTASRHAVVLAVAPCRIAPSEQWALLQAGAADVLVWPALPASADQVCSRFERLRTVRELSSSPQVTAALVGSSRDSRTGSAGRPATSSNSVAASLRSLSCTEASCSGDATTDAASSKRSKSGL